MIPFKRLLISSLRPRLIIEAFFFSFLSPVLSLLSFLGFFRGSGLPRAVPHRSSPVRAVRGLS